MNSIRKKIGLQFLVSNGSTAAGFVLSIVLARLLSPEDIGVFSISAVLVAFAHVFRDFGVSSYLKRQKTLTPEIIRAAFGVVLVSSWSVGLVLFATSSAWSDYFDQPGVKAVVEVLALGFVFIPLGAIPSAVMARDFQIEKSALVTAFSVAVYFSTSVILALCDFGYMTMAWANLANILATGIGFSVVRPKGIPWFPSLKGWSKVVHFGTGTVLASSLKALDSALPDLILGKLAGPGQVGLFSRANSTVGIVNNVLGPTINYFALPHLARTHHANQSVADELTHAYSILTSIVWPVLVFTAVLADDIVVALYGAPWLGAAAAMPWLCAALAIQSVFSLTAPALAGIGRPYLTSIPLAIVVLIKVLLGIIMYDGRLQSFALAVAVAETLSIPAYLLLLRRYVHLYPIQLAKALAKPATFAAFFALALLPIDLLFDRTSHNLFQLLILAMYAAVIWWGGVLIFNLPITQELRLAFNVLRGKSGSKQTESKSPVATNNTIQSVITYGAVAQVPPPAPFRLNFHRRAKRLFFASRDRALWKLRGTLQHLEYRNYDGPDVVNRGDQAIIEASIRTIQVLDPNLKIIRTNWEELPTKLGIGVGIYKVIVCGSGYLFFDKSGRLADRVSRDVERFRELTIPIILYGIGVNQLLGVTPIQPTELHPNDFSTLKALADLAYAISVRDKNSQYLLQHCTKKPIPLLGDPALFFETSFKCPVRKSSKLVFGINFPFHGVAANDRLKSDFNEYLRALQNIQLQTNCRFVYFCHYETEIVVAKLLQDSGIALEIVDGNPDTLLLAYKTLHLHIGGMLHSCILAASVGTPVIGLAYDVKHFGFFQLMGISEYCMAAHPFDREAILALTLAALKSQSILRDKISVRRSELRSAAADFLCKALLSEPVSLNTLD